MREAADARRARRPRDGGLIRYGVEDAVTTSGSPLDPSLAHKLVQRRGDGRVAGSGPFPDLGLGERFFGIRERLDDALFCRFRLRRHLVRHRPPPAQGGRAVHDILEALIESKLASAITVRLVSSWLDWAGQSIEQWEATAGPRPAKILAFPGPRLP